MVHHTHIHNTIDMVHNILNYIILTQFKCWCLCLINSVHEYLIHFWINCISLRNYQKNSLLNKTNSSLNFNSAGRSGKQLCILYRQRYYFVNLKIINCKTILNKTNSVSGLLPYNNYIDTFKIIKRFTSVTVIW